MLQSQLLRHLRDLERITALWSAGFSNSTWEKHGRLLRAAVPNLFHGLQGRVSWKTILPRTGMGWGRVWGNLSQVLKKGKITEAVIPIAKAHQECRHNESGSPAVYPAFVYLTV